MTASERVRQAVASELERYAAVLDAPSAGLRSVAVVVKLTPAGEVRAVIFTPEFERERPRPDAERPRTFPGTGRQSENQPAGGTAGGRG